MQQVVRTLDGVVESGMELRLGIGVEQGPEDVVVAKGDLVDFAALEPLWT
ncbi:hypothetical protein GCM10027456_10280 [Kineosporia babensis]